MQKRNPRSFYLLRKPRPGIHPIFCLWSGPVLPVSDVFITGNIRIC